MSLHREEPVDRRVARRRLQFYGRRDRGVDESGNQIAVFGRRGARPFNLTEQQKLYLRNGQVWTVTNDPPGPAIRK